MKPPRLDQLLASLGYGSRRECAAIIRDKRVTVDGEIGLDPATRVAASMVRLDGEPLEFPDGLLVMLHKPRGYVCTHSANEGNSVYELLPPRWLCRNPKVTSVGRLDKEATGLLLLTDRGELVHQWASPRAAVERTYEVEVDASSPGLLNTGGALRPELVELFESGTLHLRGEKKPLKQATLVILDKYRARISITEGRYHQIVRMFASEGLRVTRLHRIRFGKFALGDVRVGQWRALG